MRALFACVFVLLVATLAGRVESGQACSCALPDPRAALAQADGAFVGTLVSRQQLAQQAVLVFSVEKSLKGSIGRTVEVRTAANSAGCGLEAPVGTRVGLVLERRGGAWLGYLCWQFAPADLLAAAVLPAPNGRGPTAMFIGGRFGPARTIALDTKGRTLGYGVGSGTVRQLAGCPGGRRVVELVQRGSADFVVVREVPTFWLVREQRLPRPDEGVSSVRCIDPLGEKLALFASGPDARGRLLRVTPRGVATLWRGTAFYASFSNRVAYVQVLRPASTQIVRVDLRTGVTESLGTVRVEGLYELTPNPAGTRLVGSSFIEGCMTAPCAYLAVIDLRTRPISARKSPLRGYVPSDTAWVTRDTFALASKDVRIYTTSLRLTERVSGWSAGRPVVLGRSVYGIRRGRLVRAQLPGGPVRVVRRFPGQPAFITAPR